MVGYLMTWYRGGEEDCDNNYEAFNIQDAYKECFRLLKKHKNNGFVGIYRISSSGEDIGTVQEVFYDSKLREYVVHYDFSPRFVSLKSNGTIKHVLTEYYRLRKVPNIDR